MGIVSAHDATRPVRARHLFILVLMAGCAPAFANESVQPAGEIVVYGQRAPLAIDLERELREDDVAAYGVGTIGELIDEVRRERGVGDDVVILVDGKRVAGLGDIEDYPVEAIERVQVSPVGAGSSIGATASQRVYNLVLKPLVRTGVVRAGITAATEGDATSLNADAGATSIRKPRRLNLTVRHRRDSDLLESERDVIQIADDDLGQDRTLRPRLERTELGFNLADELSERISGSLTGRISRSTSRSFNGRGEDDSPLTQRSKRTGGDLTLSLNGDFGGWRTTLTGRGRADRRSSVTDVDGELPVRSVGKTREAELDVTATRSLASLPAGGIDLTLRAGWRRQSITSGGRRIAMTSREVGGSVNLPLTAATSAIGALAAGLDFNLDRVSRIGTLTTITGSLHWQPAAWLRISGLLTKSRNPPSIDLLGAPIIVTPGVRIIDPSTGGTVDVTELTGGNPELGAQRNVLRQLTVTVTPIADKQVTLTGDYTQQRTRDMVALLPPPSALLIEAFPDRFLRDGDGSLLRIDRRPVNFERMEDDRLRLGLNAVLPLGGAEQLAHKARIQVNLSYSRELRSRVTIRDNFPELDLLSPSQALLAGVARPRDEFDLSLAYTRRGMGVWLTANRRGESFARFENGDPSSSLRFEPVTILGLRAFAEAGQLFPSTGWLRGSRFTVAVVNLANRRQRVRDGEGVTPLRYQPAYQDPIGRAIQFEFRTSF